MNALYDHPKYLALCQAVRANPACDIPRFAVADWLRENGDENRATYIECELAVPANQLRKCDKDGTPLSSIGFAGPLVRSRCRCRTCSTVRKAYTVSRRHIRVEWESRVVRPAIHRRRAKLRLGPNPIHFCWSRGFIESVTVDGPSTWMEYGVEAIREHPVQRVHFHDEICRPYFTPSDPNSGIPPAEWDAVWFEDENHPAGLAPWELPAKIYNLLCRRHFPFAEFNDAETPEDAAYTALSAACIRWAENQLAQTRAGTG